MQPWIQAFAGRVIVVLASAERGVNSNEKSVSGTIYVLHEAGEWLSRRLDKNESGRTGRTRRMAFLSGQSKGLEVGQMGRKICTQ